MPANLVSFDKAKLLDGIDTLYKAVSITLGPRSKAVGIDYGFEKKILKDGVSVAKVIMLEDLTENFGAQVVSEAARKQVQECGDGTTAVIILARNIIFEAQKLIEARVPSMEITEQLPKSIEKVIAEIEKMSVPLKTIEQKRFVATISAEEESLGKLIADTIEKIGMDGAISVEESKSSETSVDWQDGMSFDKGYSSPYFVTNPDAMEAVLADSKVLITDMNLNPVEMEKFFEEVFVKKGSSLTIIGPTIPDLLRDFLVVNKLQGKIRTNYVTGPAFGDRQNAVMQDIAILTGSRFISQEKGDKLSEITYEDLGSARKITSSKDTTQIVGGGGKKTDIKERVASLKKQFVEEKSDFEQDKLKERIAKLQSGVAVIMVGGQTEVEMKERVERAKDAVGALKAALEKGIIPGGEIVYFAAERVLGDTYADRILKEALGYPFKILMENSGFDAGQMKERLIKEERQFGIDVTDGEVKDMMKVGIIDPFKTVAQALRSSVSVATQIINQAVTITPLPELNEKSK